MKGLLITAFSLFLFGAAYAQDNKSDGRNDDEGGAAPTISGALDGSPNPNHDHMHHMHMERPWNHVQTLSLSPFQYSENGVGVGLSYERAMDEDGIVSVYLPLIATWNLAQYNNNNYYNNNNAYSGQTNTMYYLMPGIKFYPTGMGRVKYAVGPSAVIGVGQRVSDNFYDPFGNTMGGTLQNRVLFGMMLNNSLNITATPHLYIGAEMGLGFTYFDRINNVNRGTVFLTQGCFKIGYTF